MENNTWEAQAQAPAEIEQEDFDEIAASMGFSSFGAQNQTHKRRKIDHTAVAAALSTPSTVHASTSKPAVAESSSQAPRLGSLLSANETVSSPNPSHSALAQYGNTTVAPGSGPATALPTFSLAQRQGQGPEQEKDKPFAYYDSSFVEDPWIHLLGRPHTQLG